MTNEDAAYIAGLFDGEGNIYHKKVMKKRRPIEKAYPTWEVRMEISMTERSIAKKPPGKGQIGRKMQYRWRCGYRDAYYVCRMIWPFAHVKLPKIQKIIDHYAGDEIENKVVNLKEYKKWRKK